MRAAENSFHESHEASIHASRCELEALEAKVKAAKSNRSPQASSSQADASRLKELKEELSRPVFVHYRDWTADKATLLELLSKSKFRAMSFADEMGVRAHGYTINKFIAANLLRKDLELLSLAGDQSCDSILIRSSATGGANLLSVRGADSPRFNLVTLAPALSIPKLRSRLTEAYPCHGITLILPSGPSVALPIESDQIARVINKVFATANPEHRVDVTLCNGAGWEAFLAANPDDYPHKGEGRPLCNLETLVSSVARAVITRRFFLEEGKLPPPSEPDRTLQLTHEDLALAKAWAQALFEMVTETKYLSQRRENAAKARESKAQTEQNPIRIAAIRKELIDLIKGDRDLMLPRSTALRLEGVSAKVLDATLEAYPQTFEVISTKRPDNNVQVKQAIVLRKGWDTPVGGNHDPAKPASEVPEAQLDDLHRQWQKEAAANLKAGGKPAITVPPELYQTGLAVQRRHWLTTSWIPSGPDRTNELWFRLAPSGRDMCDWKRSFSEWTMDKRWEMKDEMAHEDQAKADAAEKAAQADPTTDARLDQWSAESVASQANPDIHIGEPDIDMGQAADDLAMIAKVDKIAAEQALQDGVTDNGLWVNELKAMIKRRRDDVAFPFPPNGSGVRAGVSSRVRSKPAHPAGTGYRLPPADR